MRTARQTQESPQSSWVTLFTMQADQRWLPVTGFSLSNLIRAVGGLRLDREREVELTVEERGVSG